MPSRNIVKTYVKNGFYHVYNRGVEKRIIFQDEQDYIVFLSYLKEYLSPKPNILQGETLISAVRQPNNYYNKIELHTYALMPNHFHLLIKQHEENYMSQFMQSLMTRYGMYFNKKYERVGTLYQGPYKAVLIQDEVYLLHISRYIHLNWLEFTKDIINTYSSYGDYLKLKNTSWVKTNFILDYFNNATLPYLKKANNYSDFVENCPLDCESLLGGIAIDL